MSKSEQNTNSDNVAYIDEYPELRKRVWLRRLDAQRGLGQLSVSPTKSDGVEQ